MTNSKMQFSIRNLTFFTLLIMYYSKYSSSSNDIEVNVTIINLTGGTTSINFPTSQKVDVIVTSSDGIDIWQWSEGIRFGQALNSITLADGNTWSHSVTLPGDIVRNTFPDDSLEFLVKITGVPELITMADGVTITW